MSDTWIVLLQRMLGYAVPFKQRNKGDRKILLLEKKVLRERLEGWELEDTGLKAVFPELLHSWMGVCWSALKPVSDGEGIHSLLKYSVAAVWFMMSGYQTQQEQGLGSAPI